MNITKVSTLAVVAVAALFSACTVSRTPAPPLQGPSELALSLALEANPDTLSMDGASQSRITIDARDANGQLTPNVPLRVEIVANGEFVDFGSLSARTLVTGNNGRATVIYTAPVGVTGPIPTLSIRVTPSGTNAGNQIGRYVDIRLVPPGVITGGGPTPAFTVTPASPTAFIDTRFDASTSTSPLGSSLVNFSWNFGDGGSATGVVANHKFSSSGTFHVVLTVTDSNGISASTSKDVGVGGGTAPTADFTFSPAAPVVLEDINFNAGASRPGPGHSIARYDWSFGSGASQSGVTVTRAYDLPATYNVTLTVTDEVGQATQITKPVSVSNGSPTVVITASPGSPNPGNTVLFNSDGTTYFTGAGPASYAWTFGNGLTSTLANPTTTYGAIGAYTVRLTIVDTKGRTGTGTTVVNVVAATPPTPPTPPVASFTFGPNNAKAGIGSITFDGRGSTGSNLNYSWNFGDGIITPNSANPIFSGKIYAVAGTYNATLTVTDTATGLTNTSPVQAVTIVP